MGQPESRPTLRKLLGRVRRRWQRRSGRLGSIEERLTTLEKVAGFARNIDLMRLEDFFYFVYEDDGPRLMNPPESWGQHKTLSPAAIKSIVSAARSSDARRDLHEKDPVARAVWALAQTGQTVTLLYVGCSYGFHLMRLADCFKKLGLDCRIMAFDPGLAGTLLPPTLRINDLDHIEFFDVAPSSVDSFAIMQQIVGHSEDNKLVNITESPLRSSRIVETVTLDAFCRAKGVKGPIVLVVDTQGNEPEVLAGARGLLAAEAVVLVSEFTPWALGGRMPPQEFITTILEHGDVYDLGVVEDADRGDGRSLLREHVTLDRAPEFAQRVFSTPPHWTDVMVLPRGSHVRPLLDRAFGIEG